MLKLADRGVMNETLMAMIRQNTRQPVESEGDVYSLAACNDIGCQRLVEMMDEFDLRRSGSARRLHLRYLGEGGARQHREAAERRL